MLLKLLLPVALLAIPPFTGAQVPPPSSPPIPPTPEESLRATALGTIAPIEKTGPGQFRIGNVKIDQNRHQLVMPGAVNMAEGLVELLACGPKGKLHESVLVIDVNPYHVQLGLLLLGLQPGGNLDFQGDPKTPTGDLVKVTVRWEYDGVEQELRGEEFVRDSKAKQAMAKTHWVFTGSAVMDGIFMAGIEQSLIATYNDPSAIINNPLPSGADDTVYYANPLTVPPVGTAVTLVISAVGS